MARAIVGRWPLSIAISALFLYWAVSGIAWPAVWNVVTTARTAYLLLAALVGCGTYLLRAVRWRILLNAEAHFDLATVFWANMAGYLGNNVLPARAGELIRSVLISSRSQLSKTYVLTTALSERFMDVIAVVLWASIAILTIGATPPWMASLSRVLVLGSVAAAVFIAVLPHVTWLPGVAARLPLREPLRSFLQRILEQALLGVRAFHNGRRLAEFAALTVVIWTCDAATAMIVARSIGVALSFPVAVLLLTGLALGSALPSTPGYIGIYQFVAATVLPPFGIPREEALAFIVLSQALGYLVVIALGLPGWMWCNRTSEVRKPTLLPLSSIPSDPEVRS